MTGIAYIHFLFAYEGILPADSLGNEMGLAYFSIAFSLNFILTLMIITRLFLHNRKIRTAMGVLDKASALYDAIVVMLVESCALYAVSFLPFIGTWASGSTSQTIFYPILAETQVCAVPVRLDAYTFLPKYGYEQVIAPFLIVLRVANRTALTSETNISENVGTMHFVSEGESAESDGTVLDGNTVSVTDANGETSGEHGIVAEKRE